MDADRLKALEEEMTARYAKYQEAVTHARNIYWTALIPANKAKVKYLEAREKHREALNDYWIAADR